VLNTPRQAGRERKDAIPEMTVRTNPCHAKTRPERNRSAMELTARPLIEGRMALVISTYPKPPHLRPATECSTKLETPRCGLP